MIAIIWEYVIEPMQHEVFEEYYHAQGIWAQYFQQHPDFLKTQLIQDYENPLRYVTIDYWKHETSFEQFRNQYRTEYDAIDALCTSFTKSETRIGTFIELL
jgi:heme-degrading monooxygenase HmoA